MNRTLINIIKSGLFAGLTLMLTGLILHGLSPEIQKGSAPLLSGLLHGNPYSFLHLGMYIVVIIPPLSVIYIMVYAIKNKDRGLSILSFIAIIILAIVTYLKI